MDYNTLAEECVEDLKKMQSELQEQYDLGNYDWFYNQSTGLLTFSSGDEELNFKYFQAGSFSLKSNTWKWSWDNENTLENVKQQIKRLKEFGEASNYSKLTNGCFESDEYEAWEFAAIAARLLDGIGVYRPVIDEALQIYLVITEFVDNETAKKIKNRYVQCSDHEYRRISFVCQHLDHTTKVGFEEAFETFENMELGEDDDLQAWCSACENVRQQEGEWNDTSMEFAKIRIVCEGCYFEMKELNLGHR